ncbi:hypothetical protein BaRGS_00007891 [Batillaria attramentaria]|uniref:Uncharacterized protein n=1 Tax=Batillaria attramentaria TaxID=370345 RepID=A0ABD0LNH3_9CAEN
MSRVQKVARPLTDTRTPTKRRSASAINRIEKLNEEDERTTHATYEEREESTLQFVLRFTLTFSAARSGI